MSKVNHRESALSNLFVADAERPARREEKQERRSKPVPKRTHIVPYKFDQKAQAAPNVGEMVAIRHTSDNRMLSDKAGQYLDMTGKLVRSGIEVRRIKAVYLGDSDGYHIKDHNGEPWVIRPSASGAAKWETFTRGEGRKESVNQ